MQDFCKHQNEENGACRTSANVKMGKMVLAGLLQALRCCALYVFASHALLFH